MPRLALSLLMLVPVLLDSGAAPPRRPPPLGVDSELVVLTTNSATTRFLDASGRYTGLETELVERFAAEQHLHVRYQDRQPYHEILPLLAQHAAHLAAAGIGITQARTAQFDFSFPYQYVQPVVAYSTESRPAHRAADLVGYRVEVVKGSTGAERLAQLKLKYPRLSWHEVTDSDGEGLLQRLAQGKVDYVVTQSHLLNLARNFYPSLAKGFSLGDPEPLAWAFPRGEQRDLQTKAQAYFQRISADGTLRRLIDRYYGHTQRLDRSSVADFIDRMNNDLPRFRRLFREAQAVSGVDWRLLAALAYLESEWEPLATSETGVRGMMMLTSETADRMGLTDRLDPRQSILAGARYLAEVRDSLPDELVEPDRTWFALAAYNIGLAHLDDARALTLRMKGNPTLWVDVKKALPLLARFETAITLKHGYARGGGALVMTERIRGYYDILNRFQARWDPDTPLGEREPRAPAATPKFSGRAESASLRP